MVHVNGSDEERSITLRPNKNNCMKAPDPIYVSLEHTPAGCSDAIDRASRLPDGWPGSVGAPLDRTTGHGAAGVETIRLSVVDRGNDRLVGAEKHTQPARLAG
jgi:hypothetical protein